MESPPGWQPTDCAGLELCRAGNTVRGLRLLGWHEALPRSLAAVLAPGPATGLLKPVGADGIEATRPFL
ncbi:hypothetical protein ACIPW5_25910 [Streptomyces sp. NPDC090077]|uniref:hypothetical protein n=1 Tax=Streptomyces sp. NPDC090077 TaxID=3365938 RepID=UPI003823F2C4